VKPDSVIVRNDELPSAPVDPEIVFLNARLERYVALDEVGRRIWGLIAAPITVGALVDELEQEFTAPPGVIARDVLVFISELEAEGMVRVVDDGSA
jgi:coenzyme PQQ synthesis protein D (PqqD)